MKTIERISNRLDLAHLALFRGWLQGLDLNVLRQRYLGEESTRRDARETLDWIRSELIASAKKSGDGRTAGLFRRDPQRPPKTSPGLTLESFQAQVDPSGDFYTEAELLELFESAHPPARGGQRNRAARVVARQLEAVNALERRATFAPNLMDPVDAWLNPRIAKRLSFAALPTLGAVVLSIEEKGPRWWTSVPKLGAVTAARIVTWFQRNESLLDRRLSARALIPRRRLPLSELSDGFRSLEKGSTPCSLEKVIAQRSDTRSSSATVTLLPSQGYPTNTHDLELVSRFLGLHVNRQSTFRAYRKEVERFYLWLVIERGTYPTRATSQDCVDYCDFLVDPIPYDRWCAPKNHPRASEQWRPFTNGLEPSSISYARNVLTTFFTWLVLNRHIVLNPWLSVPKAAPVVRKVQPVRSGEAFDNMLAAVQPEDGDRPSISRDKFIVAFAANTGVRPGEITAITMGDFSWCDTSEGLSQRLTVKVFGKGSKQRIVDVGATAQSALVTWLVYQDLPPDPTLCPPDIKLVRTINEILHNRKGAAVRKPLSYGTVYRSVTRLTRGLAPHALRRSFITDALASGANLTDVQAMVGHSSPTTTAGYNTTVPADVGARVDHARTLKRQQRRIVRLNRAV